MHLQNTHGIYLPISGKMPMDGDHPDWPKKGDVRAEIALH